MQEHELTLDQMLADPIVRQLMARDGVAEADLRGLLARVRPRRESDPVGIWSEPRSFSPEPQSARFVETGAAKEALSTSTTAAVPRA